MLLDLFHFFVTCLHVTAKNREHPSPSKSASGLIVVTLPRSLPLAGRTHLCKLHVSGPSIIARYQRMKTNRKRTDLIGIEHKGEADRTEKRKDNRFEKKAIRKIRK